MSNAPNGTMGRQGYEAASRGNNTIGLVGFVLSLVGLIGCCFQPAALVSLAGLILSIIGLSKRPRGLAIAGTILGALGLTGILIIILAGGIGIVAYMILLVILSTALAGPEIETAVEQAILAEQVAQYIDQQGSIPVDLSQVPDIDEKLKTDPWGTLYRLDVIDVATENFLIRSAGPDKVFDTEDDITNKQN